MVLHRKKFKRQKVKIKKFSFFHERSFLHEFFQKIAPIGLHKKDMRKLNMKIEKKPFYKMSFCLIAILNIVSMVVHWKYT